MGAEEVQEGSDKGEEEALILAVGDDCPQCQDGELRVNEFSEVECDSCSFTLDPSKEA